MINEGRRELLGSSECSTDVFQVNLLKGSFVAWCASLYAGTYVDKTIYVDSHNWLAIRKHWQLRWKADELTARLLCHLFRKTNDEWLLLSLTIKCIRQLSIRIPNTADNNVHQDPSFWNPSQSQDLSFTNQVRRQDLSFKPKSCRYKDLSFKPKSEVRILVLQP